MIPDQVIDRAADLWQGRQQVLMVMPDIVDGRDVLAFHVREGARMDRFPEWFESWPVVIRSTPLIVPQSSTRSNPVNPQPFRMTVLTNPVDPDLSTRLKEAWILGVTAIWLQNAVDATFKAGLDAVTQEMIKQSGAFWSGQVIQQLEDSVLASWISLRGRSDNQDAFLDKARAYLDTFWSQAVGPVQQPAPSPTPTGVTTMEDMDPIGGNLVGSLILLVLAGIVAVAFTTLSGK